MTAKQILQKELGTVRKMSFPELREKFTDLYGKIPHPLSSTTLRNRVIYKLQELYLGGLGTTDRMLLEKIARKMKDHPGSRKSSSGISIGARYRRKWKGGNYEVTVLAENCFECGGKRYKSLSAVARSITKTQWNGKLFFGVKQ